MTHVIKWKVGARIIVGKKRFTESEAVNLAKELNVDNPQMEHEAVPFDVADAPKPETATCQSIDTNDFKMLTDYDYMPFGAHINKKMKDVPAVYLDWLSGQQWIGQWPQVNDYIKRNRKAIDMDLPKD